MKKKVLLLTMFLGMFLYSSAQTIDLYGKGVFGEAVTNMCFCNPANVSTVIADVHFKHSIFDANGPTELCNCNGGNDCFIQNCEFDYNYTDAEAFTGYFTHTFTDVSNTGIKKMSLENLHGIESFYLFVFRDLPTPTHYSAYNTDNVFFYQNGISAPFVYNLSINTAPNERTIIVTIPISELNDDDRNVVIDITAGDVTAQRKFTRQNKGKSLNITPIVLEGVSGDVTNVSVSIYSPIRNSSGWGDSFITGGVVVDVLSDKHCTFTQGYYGNYGGLVCGVQSTYDLMYGLLFKPLIIGDPDGDNKLTITRDGTGDEFSGDGVDCLIGRLPGGGKSAVLNGVATCDDPVGIKTHKKSGRFKNTLLAQAITLGLNLRHDVNLGMVALEDNVFYTTEALDCSDPETVGTGNSVGYEVGQKVINYLGADNTIDDLFALGNKALAGDNISPLKLGDVTDAMAAINEGFDECRLLDGFASTKAAVANVGVENESNGLKVYPNPTYDVCNIDFTTVDGDTRVELYNIMGKRMDVLFSGPTTEDTEYSVEFSSQSYPAGMYFVIVRNGTSIQKQKVSIMR